MIDYNEKTPFDTVLSSAKLYLDTLSKVINLCSIRPFDSKEIVDLKRSIIMKITTNLEDSREDNNTDIQ